VNTAVGDTTAVFEILGVTWHDIDFKLPEDDMIVSKHVGV